MGWSESVASLSTPRLTSSAPALLASGTGAPGARGESVRSHSGIWGYLPVKRDTLLPPDAKERTAKISVEYEKSHKGGGTERARKRH